jgi:Fe-S-cluster containining protein
MQPFYESHELHFSCTRCGRCCETAGDYYVFLSRQEAERIRDYLQLSSAWFRRRYLSRLDDGERVLAAGIDERCIFLDGYGQCRIYPVRPVQCRTYPFWPEVVNSRRDWSAEAARCEGINRGNAVPVKKIRHAVKACIEQTD